MAQALTEYDYVALVTVLLTLLSVVWVGRFVVGFWRGLCAGVREEVSKPEPARAKRELII